MTKWGKRTIQTMAPAQQRNLHQLIISVFLAFGHFQMNKILTGCLQKWTNLPKFHWKFGSILGQAFVFPRNHHLPKMCWSQPWGYSSSKSLAPYKRWRARKSKDRPNGLPIGRFRDLTNTDHPSKTSHFVLVGWTRLPVWRDLRYPLQSEWASSNYK